MSEWITDRRPTVNDAHCGFVWITTKRGDVFREIWKDVCNHPWMPIIPPEPYVTKRYSVAALRGTISGTTWYEVWDEMEETRVAVQIPTREAAERIAAIYEEVMP